MRWYRKIKECGTIRYRKRFALLPICVNREVRWLETVYLKQTLSSDWDDVWWDNIKFLTKEEYENAINPPIVASKSCWWCDYYDTNKCHYQGIPNIDKEYYCHSCKSTGANQ